MGTSPKRSDRLHRFENALYFCAVCSCYIAGALSIGLRPGITTWTYQKAICLVVMDAAGIVSLGLLVLGFMRMYRERKRKRSALTMIGLVGSLLFALFWIIAAPA